MQHQTSFPSIVNYEEIFFQIEILTASQQNERALSSSVRKGGGYYFREQELFLSSIFSFFFEVHSR